MQILANGFDSKLGIVGTTIKEKVDMSAAPGTQKTYCKYLQTATHFETASGSGHIRFVRWNFLMK